MGKYILVAGDQTGEWKSEVIKPVNINPCYSIDNIYVYLGAHW
jgi:hypothetical protein